MYKPHTIEQYKIQRFLDETFAMEHFLVSPLSRTSLLLEDETGEQLAFGFLDDEVREIPLPPPADPEKIKDFIRRFRALNPKPRLRTFEDITRWWLDHPNPLTYQQALGLSDELYRHFLSHPMIDEEDAYRLASSGLVSEDDYRDIQLWYLDGNTISHWLGPFGVDGTGNLYRLIASLRVVKQGEHKQRLLRPCIFSGGQCIQPCAALGSVGFQQIERTLQVNICPGSPAKFLNEIISLIAYKHCVSLTLAGVAQGQCKSAENAHIRAQLFLEPLQYFTGVTQAVSFKIAGNILISLPDLSHFLLTVKDSHLIVLRHLYDQFRKGMIQRKVNDLLVGTVCRYDFLVHNISLLFTAANARR